MRSDVLILSVFLLNSTTGFATCEAGDEEAQSISMAAFEAGPMHAPTMALKPIGDDAKRFPSMAPPDNLQRRSTEQAMGIKEARSEATLPPGLAQPETGPKKEPSMANCD